MNNINGYDMTSAMEFVNSISASQPDPVIYRKIAMEAIVGESRSKMIEILYKDIINKSNCDFGKIPESKGVLTQLTYYKTMSSSMEVLNKLLAEKPPEELKMMNKLHDMIIAERANFAMGFTFDIDMIKVMYNTLVVALIDMINLCILAYADYLKDTKKIEINFRSSSNYDKLVVTSVKTILRSYQRGEWGKMMNAFKRETTGSHGIAITATAVFATLAVSVAFAISIVAILNAIRQLIYMYYNASIRVAKKIELQMELLEANMDIEKNPDALDKQKRLYQKLAGIRDFIHIYLLKDETKGKEDMTKANKTEFDKESIKPQPPADIDDIELG